jgi:hypothetical protein
MSDGDPSQAISVSRKYFEIMATAVNKPNSNFALLVLMI